MCLEFQQVASPLFFKVKMLIGICGFGLRKIHGFDDDENEFVLSSKYLMHGKYNVSHDRIVGDVNSPSEQMSDGNSEQKCIQNEESTLHGFGPQQN